MEFMEDRFPNNIKIPNNNFQTLFSKILSGKYRSFESTYSTSAISASSTTTSPYPE